jgi:hypothetical protein
VSLRSRRLAKLGKDQHGEDQLNKDQNAIGALR